MKRVAFSNLAAAAVMALAGLGVSASSAAAQPAPDLAPLDRPATSVRSPARAAVLGVASSGKRLVAVGERGLILWSDDEGKQWTQAPVPASVTLTSVVLATAERGWAAGHGALILHTEDGGKTWRRQFDSRQLSRQASSPQSGGSNVARFLAEELADKPVLDLAFADAKIGLAVGASGLVLRTVDGGVNWQLQARLLDNPEALHLYSVRMRGRKVLIAGEQGHLYLSEDGAESFRLLSTPYQGSLFRAEMTDAGAIVAIGLRGNLVVSADAGKTWAVIKLPTDSPLTTLTVSEAGEALIGAQSGQLFKYRLGQSDVLEAPRRVPPMLSAVLRLGGETIMSVGLRGINVQSQGN